jgi:hypothetical protein
VDLQTSAVASHDVGLKEVVAEIEIDQPQGR